MHTHIDKNQSKKQARNDFAIELSLAIRALYTAANAAPGPAFRKLLTRAAADIEDAKRVYGVREKATRAADRLVQNAEGRAA